MNNETPYDYARYDAGMEGVYFCRAAADGAFVKMLDYGLFSYCVMIRAGTVIFETDFPRNMRVELATGDTITISGLSRHRFWTAGADLSTEAGVFERRAMNDRQTMGNVDLVLGVAPSEALALSSLMFGPTIVRASAEGDLSRRLWAAVEMIDGEYADERWSDQHLVVRRLAEIIEIILVRRVFLDHRDPGLFQGPAGMNILQAVRAFFLAPDRNWTIKELARSAGMSRTGFAKRFKSVTGQTPARIISRIRLTAIADRLAAKSLSIEAAAETAGYSSAAAFVRAFQREFGQTPARWRRNQLGPEWAQSVRSNATGEKCSQAPMQAKQEAKTCTNCGACRVCSINLPNFDLYPYSHAGNIP